MLSNNIIHKQIIDIHARQNTDGMALQKTTEDFVKFSLQPKLESLLDQYNRPDSHILIDELLVEVDIRSAEFDDYLLAQVLTEVQTLLESKITHTDKKQSPIVYADRLVQTLAFYLMNGYMPWWAPVKDSGEWKKTLHELFSKPQASVNWDILKTAIKKPFSLDRLFSVLTEIQLWGVIKLFCNDLEAEVEIIKGDVWTLAQLIFENTAREMFTGKIQRALLLSIAAESHPEKIRTASIRNLSEEFRKAFGSNFILQKNIPIESALLKTVVEKLFFNSEPSTKATTERLTANWQKTTQEIDDEDHVEIYIRNSGLCLIAPYLPGFFKNIGLIKDGKILNLNKAVSLLNFLVGGSATFADFEVVLPKIFCGASLNTVSQSFRLKAEDKKHCRELLTAVITNWEGLKNTSVAGLQQSFLQRDGKLSRQQDNWLLTVEQKPYDMLLKQLPWSINMIRHTWMKEMVLVEWI